MRRRAIMAGASALAMLTAQPATAQTAITPDGQPGVSTGTTATTTGTTTLIDGGRRVGDNLFHSFTGFSLGSGDSAVWVRSAGDGGSVANIINRVTGGTISTIDGRITTQGLDRANFFFINPAGIIFGANASVAVPNAAYFSTANTLRFADGGVFGVTTPGGSTFSMAAPSAFGFVGARGDITVRSAGAGFAGPNTSLSLSAANVTIDRSIFTPGALDLLAVGSTNIDVGLAQPLAGRFASGSISLTNSSITVEPSARQAGLLRANAGRITLASSILASDSNSRAATGLRVLTGDLTLRATAGGAYQTYLGSFAPGIGNAGTVDIDALRITLSNASQISSQALQGARGNAGDIRLRTGSLVVDTAASIISSAYGDSRSGNIAITADSIAIASGGLIESTTFGSGNGGDLVINTGSLTMDNGVIAAEAEQGATGDAGTITLAASTVSLTNGARISSSNLGAGIGGLVDITADTITLRNGSRIEADAIGPASGGAGDVIVAGRVIRIESGSEISSVTDGSGDAGTVSITSDMLVLDNGRLASAAQGGTGAAGTILVSANALDLRNAGEITTSTLGTGAAGLIQISTRAITMASNARITSETFATGRAGDIVIQPRDGVAPDISLTGEARISSSQASGDATGDTGTITITARAMTLSGASAITSSSEPVDGRSGAISITADTLRVNGSRIETNSDNRNPAGFIQVRVGTLTLDRGTIRSENGTSFVGSAGDILIEAQRIELLNGGNISTDSFSGPAGNITLLLPRTGTLLLRGAVDSGVITTSSGPGTGGLITISNPYLILSDGGQILALGDAFGADVLLQSDFYIRSSDRLNRLSVNGSLLVDSQVGDLSTGAEVADLSFLDASSVLRGQCASTRRGGTNQLNLRATGPYAGIVAPDPRGKALALAPASWKLCGQ
ncbi:filamentous hemagglutinin N-terminal domain-containing protein [Sphingomonas sp.]|uniref:two-partner secretion domain-containing protein n=1 Tax=Sphingomonas sp. TaxID=28214 RepID=UPI001D376D5F|nr:filamentous hemagglutinin N-terminal domain-containing protein [Sphingomonas sp.]MBX9796954.1 filamentous hemagglutinin N-terminal domain-containing protein [Sphingomonas sp.]